MRELHLHIGLHKTGTTHLQAGLKANEAALEGAGFRMGPLQNPRGEHFDLVRVLDTDGPARCVEALRDAPGERLIVSSEQFSWLFLDREAARGFAEAAKAHFFTRTYIWLRRQDLLQESYFKEKMKVPYDDKKKEEIEYPCDHAERLAILEDAFGAEALVVRLYRDDRRSDAFGEFLALLGLDPTGFEKPAPQNVSLTRRETLLLSRLPKSDLRLIRFHRRVLPVLTAGNRVADDGERFFLSPAERRAILEPHLSANRAIAERWGFEDAEWFWTLPPDEPGWTPPRPITAREWLGVWFDCVKGIVRWQGRPRGLKQAAALSAMFLQAALDRE